MERKSDDVTDAQLAVLQVLWERGPSTIRELTDILYPPAKEAEYATVQKLLERLETRNHVRRDRSQRAHVFEPVTRLDTLVGNRMRELAEKLCGGQMAPLLTHLIRAEALTDEEREQLRALIDDLDKQSKRSSKSKRS